MSGSAKRRDRSARRGTVGANEHLEVWRKGLRHLTDHGRMLCLLGEGLEALLAAALDGKGGPVDEDVAASTLLNVAQGVLESNPRRNANPPAPGNLAGPRQRPTNAASRAVLESRAAENFLDGKDLSTAWCPVMWLGSREVRGTWATLALGVGLDGVRRVLGLREGSVRDERVAEGLIGDLAVRGLPSAGGVLVVTSGSRTLDACVESAWGRRAVVSHCRHQVIEEVISHVGESERAVVHGQLTGAWSLPVDQGRALLEALVERLERSAPGAAERLARSVEPTLLVDTMGVPEPLKDRLTSMGTCRMAFKRGFHWGSSTDAGVHGLTAGLKVWLGRTRRLIGWQHLAPLAAVLQRTVAASAPAPRS